MVLSHFISYFFSHFSLQTATILVLLMWRYINVCLLLLLYGWSKCASVIGSNGVTWYKINFTSDCTQTQ